MTNNQVIQFEHIQSLSMHGDGPRWSERVEARVTLTDRALSSGWLREHFTGRKGGATDLVVLLTIVMHARPLKGDDLQHLIDLKMASEDDEGRLYARITDKGLAKELGIYRETIAASTKRLANAGFIKIVATRGQPFRDSHGQFKGSKIYLVAGELDQFLPKTLVSTAFSDADNDSHRAASDRTDDPDHAALCRTVSPNNVSTVRHQTAHRAASSGTNIKMIDEEGEEEFLEKIAEHEIFSRFTQLLGRAYPQSAKDRQALTSLAAEGYSTADILAAIERTTDHLGGSLHSVRSFAYLLPEVRRFPPASTGGNSVSQVDSDSTAGDSAPPAGSAPAQFAQTEPIILPEEVERAFCAVMQHPPTPVERQRLVWLHADTAKTWEDILSAIKFQLNPEARNPVAYLRKLLLNGAARKQRPQPKTHRDKPPGHRSALTVVEKDHPPIQLADSMVLTRPPERSSGFVDPSEAVQRNLYDSIKAVRELDCRLNLSNPGCKNGKS